MKVINYKEAAMNIGKLFYRCGTPDEILDEIRIDRNEKGEIRHVYLTYFDGDIHKFEPNKITHYPVNKGL